MRYSKRKPMRQWIKEKLDSKSYPGLRWIDKNRGKFEISWKHGSLETWSWEEDVHVFREWAIYTGKYQPHNKTVTQEDIELAKTWKTNFRCALNALPGVEMVKEESSARGANARKVYIMKVDNKKKKKRRCEDQKSLDLETKPLTPISEGIDQQAIDEIERQLSQSSTIFKKDLADLGEMEDIFQCGIGDFFTE
ncbi:interferon regulatory factor 2 isoform X2 [Exaiptasia diaphana]|uniref:IRF tryptophan pentad repeat domain-containing protein n=1 Tax=Exaiptasia diaphana TaxID=2652724 RepID=A0A913XB10_EXADI|nr:interferon regulatory factor 2 isoform X2 [Exaiptasia diaphana]KXJ13438.1 Interferon regulatory factor 2 [Exaiptasia diaphana]